MIETATVKLLAGAAVCAGIAGIAWTWQGDRQETKAAKVEVKAQQATIQTQTIYRVTDQQRQEIVNEVRTQYAAEVASSSQAASAARGDADRLRKLLAGARAATPASAASTARGADDPATVRQVLGSCVGEHQGLGEDADVVADRLSGLQAYVLKLLANQKELQRRLDELPQN
jgi:hypothetical protein